MTRIALMGGATMPTAEEAPQRSGAKCRGVDQARSARIIPELDHLRELKTAANHSECRKRNLRLDVRQLQIFEIPLGHMV
jgi:hypothetical protein